MAERPSSLTFTEKELLARSAELQQAVTIDLIDEAGARALSLVEGVRLMSEKKARKVGKKVQELIDSIEEIRARYFPAVDEMKNDEIVDPVAAAEEVGYVADAEAPQELSAPEEAASYDEALVGDWLNSRHIDYSSVDEVAEPEVVVADDSVEADSIPDAASDVDLSDEDNVEAQIARELAGLPAVEEPVATLEVVPAEHLFDEVLVTDADRDISGMMALQAVIDTEPTVSEGQENFSEQAEASIESNLSESGRAWLEKIAGVNWREVLDVDVNADAATIAQALPLIVAIRKPNTPEVVVLMFKGLLEGKTNEEIGAALDKTGKNVWVTLKRHADALQAYYNVNTKDAEKVDDSGFEVEASNTDDQEKEDLDPLLDILLEAGYSEDYAEALLKRASVERGDYQAYTHATDRAIQTLRLEFVRQQGLTDHEEVHRAMKAFFLPYANASNLDAIAVALGDGRTVKDASELVLKGIELLYAEQAKEEAA